MGKKQSHKLENRAELSRLRTRIETELEKENPHWDLLDSTFARIKVVFKHAQFSNLHEKHSFEEWREAAENQSNQKREPARFTQLKELELLVISVNGIVKHLDSTRLSYRKRTDHAWKEIRNLRSFIKHTHFASARGRELALKELHRLVYEVKEYERGQLKKPDGPRFIAIHQISQLAQEARAPNLNVETPLSCERKSKPASCDLKTFYAARTTLTTYREMLERCSKTSHKAWEMYVLNRVLMLSRQKATTFNLLRDVQKQLHTAWDYWLEQWRTLYAARLSELTLSEKNGNELRALEYENLCAQLARGHAHKMELEEKLESGQDSRVRDEVQGWLVEEKQRIADLRVKIKTFKHRS